VYMDVVRPIYPERGLSPSVHSGWTQFASPLCKPSSEEPPPLATPVRTVVRRQRVFKPAGRGPDPGLRAGLPGPPSCLNRTRRGWPLGVGLLVTPTGPFCQRFYPPSLNDSWRPPPHRAGPSRRSPSAPQRRRGKHPLGRPVHHPFFIQGNSTVVWRCPGASPTLAGPLRAEQRRSAAALKIQSALGFSTRGGLDD